MEEALIKRDIKRQKVNEAHDTPGALALANQANELQMVRRRTKMMLPSPQVGVGQAQGCRGAAHLLPAARCVLRRC